MSSDIITNMVVANVKERAFLCVSLLVFVTFFIITNQFLSLGVAPWSECGPNHVKDSLCHLLVFLVLLQHFCLPVLLQHSVNITNVATF